MKNVPQELDSFTARIVSTKAVDNALRLGFVIELEKQDGTRVFIYKTIRHDNPREEAAFFTALERLRDQLGKRLVSRDLTDFFETESFYNVELAIKEMEYYNSKYDKTINWFEIK
jgi:hypothetical protein